jgi:hypothetical protein
MNKHFMANSIMKKLIVAKINMNWNNYGKLAMAKLEMVKLTMSK